MSEFEILPWTCCSLLPSFTLPYVRGLPRNCPAATSYFLMRWISSHVKTSCPISVNQELAYPVARQLTWAAATSYRNP